MRKFDVLIPVGPNEVKFSYRVVDFVCRCFLGLEHIYLITSAKNFDKLQKSITKWRDVCKVIDEDKLLPGLTFKSVDALLKKYSAKKRMRSAWYFQQFIKLAFAQSEYCKLYYLSWDADTLPLAPISFFEGEQILFNPKCEFNPNYFKTIERLFGYGKQVPYSFIAENMMFSKQIVCEMLSEIESRCNNGEKWMEKVISLCDFNNPLPPFSEFETYGTFCYVNYPHLYKKRFLNTFREAGFINGRNISEEKLRIMSFDLDTASFENWHEPLFPYNIPNIIDRYKKRLFKICEGTITFKDLLGKIFRVSRNSKLEFTSETLYRLPSARQ